MSSRSRKTAELARERMRAQTYERESGDAALRWVLPTPPPLRNGEPQRDPGRARAPPGATERTG